MKKELSMIFTGGGSGGHVMPAYSMIELVSEYCLKHDIKFCILYIGSKNSIEENITGLHNIPFKRVSTGKLRRYFSLKNLTDIFRIILGFFQSFFILNRIKPHLLFSTGGFVSVPPVIAAKLLKIPVIIHEQTIDAGLANKIAGRFADKICLTFEESSKYFQSDKTVVTGIPQRKEIFSGTKVNALKRFGFDPDLPVILFIGGGLGCHKLNVTGIEILPILLERCNIIFQTGRSGDNTDFEDMKNFYNDLDDYKKNRMKLFDFINEEIGDIYALTNLAVARSGAGTVCEFISLKIPAIFIPLAIATNNEQYRNAKIMEKAGSAVIIEERNLDKVTMLEIINEIVFTGKLESMKKNFAGLPELNGGEQLLNEIISML
jgi:UDP-N-acetylglucosamine--N-acetylmuramyl-(pentapeptide) pyrophosphoryl-undecaprenol N-acetylglucosamine transferase